MRLIHGDFAVFSLSRLVVLIPPPLFFACWQACLLGPDGAASTRRAHGVTNFPGGISDVGARRESLSALGPDVGGLDGVERGRIIRRNLNDVVNGLFGLLAGCPDQL